jgi:hypothetical protein
VELLGAHIDVTALSDAELRAHVTHLREQLQPVPPDAPSPQRALLEAEAELYGCQLADPLGTWQPTPRQWLFIKAVLVGNPPVLFAAGNRSGKSSAAAYCAATLARFGIDPEHGAYSSGGAVSVWD